MKLKVAQLSRGGKDISFELDPDQRASIAAELSIPELRALDVHISAWPWGRGGVKLTGELHASVVQTCVVTFKPVAEDLAERFVRTYLPKTELDSLQHKLGLSETAEVSLESDDPPEALAASEIDLRAILVEELALALNPYPRDGDAEVADLARKSPSNVAAGPFDALKKLSGQNDA